MRDDSLDDSWKSASVAEIDGEIAGASVGHGLPSEILSQSASHPSLAPLLALQQRVVGNWFIDSLAVYRSHRRKGIGRKLLEHELSQAGNRLLSLVTESHNPAALGLYGAFGFEEQARVDAFRISEKNEPYQWVLMTRPRAH